MLNFGGCTWNPTLGSHILEDLTHSLEAQPPKKTGQMGSRYCIHVSVQIENLSPTWISLKWMGVPFQKATYEVAIIWPDICKNTYCQTLLSDVPLQITKTGGGAILRILRNFAPFSGWKKTFQPLTGDRSHVSHEIKIKLAIESWVSLYWRNVNPHIIG